MGSSKLRSVLTGTIAAVALVGGSATGFASGLVAPLACATAQMGVSSFAQLNVAATQGCVLPVVDQVAQAPIAEPVMNPEAVGIPQRAAGLPRGAIIAGALAAGLAVAFVASRGSNGRLPISV